MYGNLWSNRGLCIREVNVIVLEYLFGDDVKDRQGGRGVNKPIRYCTAFTSSVCTYTAEEILGIDNSETG